MNRYDFGRGATLLATVTLLASCGGGKKQQGGLPDGFATMGDRARVEYMVAHAAPDSVARYLIYGALGRSDAKVDTLALATNYAYESLKGEALDKFSAEYDSLVESLPLEDKMRIYVLAGTEDPQRLGYSLGLEYLGTIRDGNKSVADIERELAGFKRACGQDTATYRRFIIGFRTVLDMDRGKDLPDDVYKKFRNYE